MALFKKYNDPDSSYEVKTLEDISNLYSNTLSLKHIDFVKRDNKDFPYLVIYVKSDGIDLVSYELGYCTEQIGVIAIHEEIYKLSRAIQNAVIPTDRCKLIWSLLTKSEQESIAILWSQTRGCGELIHTDTTKSLINLRLITKFVVNDLWDNYALSYLGAYVYKYGAIT